MDQLTLGDSLRDAGMAAALDNAGEDWRRRARAYAEFSARIGRRFTAEDVRRAAGDPPSINAMGALFGVLSKAGLIRPAGRVKPERASRHSNWITVWEAA